MSASEIDRTLVRLAHEILERSTNLDQLASRLGFKKHGAISGSSSSSVTGAPASSASA